MVPTDARAADIEYLNQADADARFADRRGDITGQILHLPMAGRSELKFLLINHEVLLLQAITGQDRVAKALVRCITLRA